MASGWGDQCFDQLCPRLSWRESWTVLGIFQQKIGTQRCSNLSPLLVWQRLSQPFAGLSTLGFAEYRHISVISGYSVSGGQARRRLRLRNSHISKRL
jgi:hypothetical protein